MKKRIYFSLLLFLVCVHVAWAQGQIRGRILDKKSNTPLEFINVAIRKQGDTKIFKGAISDTEGSFLITGLPDGQYTLTTSFTGYKDVVRAFSVSKSNANHNYPAIYMAEDAQALDEVTVLGQRSEMKLEVDRKSFNVDQQISNAGATASEVLENIPSVEVDNEGNVSLRGNTSVEVWINGKSSGLTSDNRGEILQQMPAESIERIEVIDNPSAKFSAEGSAGIINIVLKKDVVRATMVRRRLVPTPVAASTPLTISITTHRCLMRISTSAIVIARCGVGDVVARLFWPTIVIRTMIMRVEDMATTSSPVQDSRSMRRRKMIFLSTEC